MEILKIKSQNVNGIVDNQKRNQVFYNFKQSKYHIFLIQEAHSTFETETKWKSEWCGDILFSHGTTESRGTCILFKENISKKIHQVISDQGGRYLILDIEINDFRFTLASLYAPNEDNPGFYLEFINRVESIGNDNRIIGGDWNLVLDLDKDKRGGVYRTNAKAADVVHSWMDDTDLCDIFRHLHPEQYCYTWKRLQPTPGIFCRLDFFLISFGLVNKVDKADIMPGFKSDHSAPVLLLEILSTKRGPGYWKLNCTHLSDPDFIAEIKKVIIETSEANQEADPQLLWDTIKCQIRGSAIQFSAKKKKSKTNLLNLLENRIKRLENDLIVNNSHDTKQRLKEANDDYNKILEEQCKGALVRSRIQWFEEGERPTKYFLNLEKRNGNNKNISRLMLNDGSFVTDSFEILRYQKDYYSKLYASTYHENNENELHHFLEDLDIPKLTEVQKNNMEGPITEAELLLSLKNTANGKAPGIDGLPADFYKVFWNDIKKYLLDSYNTSYSIGRMSLTQKQGIICLIPKKDKDIKLLKNWRPLTLLNADYKILAKTIGNRIKTNMKDIIHSDQTGFLKGRYIGENIIRLLDIMEYTEAEDIPALLIALDFEKAYDSVEWLYLHKVLEVFNFGNTIINWIKVCYQDILSYVTNNGWISEPFSPGRGVRQGCPLSPYLFTLCIELLAISIRGNDKIKGIQINGNTHKISQFADDANLTILYCIESLNEVLKTLDTFQIISGLKVNYDKTEIMRIGSLKNSQARLYTQKPLRWTQDPVTILGIKIALDDSIIQMNFQPLINKAKSLIYLWQQRDLTWFGKVTVINSLLASQFIYRLSVLPSPGENIFKQLEDIFLDFLWGYGKHFVSKETVTGRLAQGGLSMVDIKKKNIALKCAWVKRLNADATASWKALAESYFPGTNGAFWEGNLSYCDCLRILKQRFCTKFWQDVALSWSIYTYTIPTKHVEVLYQPIFYNSHIKINNIPYFDGQYHSKGIKRIVDIIDNDGNILNFNDLSEKYGINNSIASLMVYNSIVSAIPQSWKQIIKNKRIQHQQGKISNLEQINKVFKVTKLVYEALIKTGSQCPPHITQKWSVDLNKEVTDDIVSKAFVAINSTTIIPKLREFQYRLLHRNLITNKLLSQWRIKESDLCTFCNEEEESLFHLLWDCTFAFQAWQKLFNWLHDKTNVNINFTIEEILFGNNDSDNFKAYNTIFIVTKYCIYSDKCNETLPNFEKIVKKIKYIHAAEKKIAINRQRLTEHNKKWILLTNCFN